MSAALTSAVRRVVPEPTFAAEPMTPTGFFDTNERFVEAMNRMLATYEDVTATMRDLTALLSRLPRLGRRARRRNRLKFACFNAHMNRFPRPADAGYSP
jgi:hypothetical protein